MADDSKSPGAPPSEPPPPPKKDGEETKEEEQPKDSDAKSSGKDPRDRRWNKISTNIGSWFGRTSVTSDDKSEKNQENKAGGEGDGPTLGMEGMIWLKPYTGSKGLFSIMDISVPRRYMAVSPTSLRIFKDKGSFSSKQPPEITLKIQTVDAVVRTFDLAGHQAHTISISIAKEKKRWRFFVESKERADEWVGAIKECRLKALLQPKGSEEAEAETKIENSRNSGSFSDSSERIPSQGTDRVDMGGVVEQLSEADIYKERSNAYKDAMKRMATELEDVKATLLERDQQILELQAGGTVDDGGSEIDRTTLSVARVSENEQVEDGRVEELKSALKEKEEKIQNLEITLSAIKAEVSVLRASAEKGEERANTAERNADTERKKRGKLQETSRSQQSQLRKTMLLLEAERLRSKQAISRAEASAKATARSRERQLEREYQAKVEGMVEKTRVVIQQQALDRAQASIDIALTAERKDNRQRMDDLKATHEREIEALSIKLQKADKQIKVEREAREEEVIAALRAREDLRAAEEKAKNAEDAKRRADEVLAKAKTMIVNLSDLKDTMASDAENSRQASAKIIDELEKTHKLTIQGLESQLQEARNFCQKFKTENLALKKRARYLDLKQLHRGGRASAKDEDLGMALWELGERNRNLEIEREKMKKEIESLSRLVASASKQDIKSSTSTDRRAAVAAQRRIPGGVPANTAGMSAQAINDTIQMHRVAAKWRAEENAKLQQQIQDLKLTHSRLLDACKSKHKDDMDALEGKCNDQIRKLKFAFATERALLTSAASNADTQARKTIENLERERDELFNSLREVQRRLSDPNELISGQDNLDNRNLPGHLESFVQDRSAHTA
ncbi:hypothetical protein AAMO2058_000519800 [Amorphochlora amoebiformis]